MFAHTEEYGVPEGIDIVEVYNGGSRADRPNCDRQCGEIWLSRNWRQRRTHRESYRPLRNTVPDGITTMGELVEALHAGEFEALTFKNK